MEPSSMVPKVQIEHLYKFVAVAGLVLFVAGLTQYCAFSKERRTTANQITRDSEDGLRKDVALQFQILQNDPVRKHRVQEHLNEFTVCRHAELSVLLRSRLKENTAAYRPLLCRLQWTYGVGAGLVVIGGCLWYWLVQRHRDRAERGEAKSKPRRLSEREQQASGVSRGFRNRKRRR